MYEVNAGVERQRRASRRSATMLLATVLTLGLLWGVGQIPVPYVVESPGPTLDTLGAEGGKTLITVEDAESYPTDGKLLATTVSVWGGPGSDMSILRLLSLWADNDTVLPEHYVFDAQETPEERDTAGATEQTSSQEDATVAALEELGKKVPATLTVAAAMPGGPAEGKIAKDDRLTSIDGATLTTYPDLVDAMAKVKPGQQVTVGFTRGGKPHTVTVEATKGDDGNAILGVALTPTYDLPITVDFNIENVGGPSAGTMYALGIIDKLTPGSLTGGKTIAGTGTVDAAGRVGEIGGAEQKIRGAERDGAHYFLVPTTNCADLAGKTPAGIVPVPIDTLHEAHQYVQDIAKNQTADLPTCQTAIASTDR